MQDLRVRAEAFGDASDDLCPAAIHLLPEIEKGSCQSSLLLLEHEDRSRIGEAEKLVDESHPSSVHCEARTGPAAGLDTLTRKQPREILNTFLTVLGKFVDESSGLAIGQALLDKPEALDRIHDSCQGLLNGGSGGRG